jgi:hypothetical protein
MSASQNFVDNLEHLHTVVSVALDHLEANREQFADTATPAEKLRVERTIHHIRTLLDALEKEFHGLEEGNSKTAQSVG